MPDRIQSAYKRSKNIYDSVLTQDNFLSRLYIRLFWSGTDDNAIARTMLDWIPGDFSGRLLDVPVGTAVFTHEKYARLSKAEIICLDYSEDMIRQAEQRLAGLSQARCVRGDVGQLPFDDESCDIVLSMNGFHAFPDKERAFSETWRVLKKGGRFIACFYIRGESRVTDWLVRCVLSKKGWFTPPFDMREALEARLKKIYRALDLHVDGSMVYFSCVKP